MTTAFVLGGGGILGAVEVGMLRALFERGITPDLVLGTSVGAVNGALVAREPRLPVIDRLTRLGHEVKLVDKPHGGGQAILIDRKAGHFIGGSDPRKDGLALGF